MQPLDAMQRLLSLVDELHGLHPSQRPVTEEQAQEELTAVAVIQAMLNTALPIAKFRCMVQVDAKSQRRGKIRDEYTICSPTISGILAGLIGLHHAMTDVYITLWEQKPEGATMLSGYQGPSKTKRYRSWIESLLQFEFVPPEATTDAED